MLSWMTTLIVLGALVAGYEVPEDKSSKPSDTGSEQAESTQGGAEDSGSSDGAGGIGPLMLIGLLGLRRWRGSEDTTTGDPGPAHPR